MQHTAPTRTAVTPDEPPRRAFSLVITFDPSRPQTATMNVMPVGGDGNGTHIDDVVTALRMGYEQALLQKGAWLPQQQIAAPRTPNNDKEKSVIA